MKKRILNGNKILSKYLSQMSALKNKLASTDYKALKFAEGELTVSEYAPIKEERRKLRAEINALETKINALKA